MGDVVGDYGSVQDRNAERYDPKQRRSEPHSSRFHADLADAQWRALDDLLESEALIPNARSMRDAVKAFVARHGKAVGSAPFLLGLRAFLEAQRGNETVVAWIVSPAVFTQSGGVDWMRDAVHAIASGADRRVDLEGDPVGKSLPLSDAGKRLAWSLPLELRDGDIDEVLSQIPSKARLEDAGCGPTGTVVSDGAHPPGAPPRRTGTGKRRGCRSRCCFLPFLFVVATLCCVVVLVH